jgi:putative ABC transport system permease protein
MLQDIRQTLRPLYRRPGASIAIVSMLALGIGMTSAVFGIVDGVVIKPLPYRDPSTLVTARAVTAAAMDEWGRRTRALSHLAHYDFSLAPLVLGGGDATRLRQGAVSHNLLDTLGVAPRLGRGFTRADAEAGAEPVVILTHGVWLDQFGGRPDVIGELAPFEPVRRRVIGVLSPEFMFPMRPAPTVGDVRILTVLPLAQPADRTFGMVARLAPRATLDQARAEEAAIVGSEPKALRASVTDLASAMLGSHRPTLSMLLGAVVLLLLIACGNVTHLLLARALDGRRELAVRVALGARRSQIVRVVLMQGCALCLAGGLVGLLIAYLGFDVFRALTPVPLPRADAAGIDLRVVAFALALSMASGLGVSLLPAWQLSRIDLGRAIESSRRTTAGSHRLRHGLLALEVALAVILLAGAGLAFNSFVRLLHVDLGFDAEHVLTLRTRGPESRYPTAEHQRALLDRVLERLSSLQGVEAAGAVDLLPATRALGGGSIGVLDPPGLPPIDAETRTIAGDYLATMRIDVMRGRAFSRADGPNGVQVALVNEALARRLPGEPIGRRIRHRDVEREIVGIVRDVRAFAVDTAPGPQVYVPHTQTPFTPGRLVIRAAGSPEQLAAAVRAELRAVEPSAPVEDVRTLSSHVAASIAHPRFQASLLAAFGISGLLLISVGVAGIVSYAIARRTREIGVRIALGARRRDVIRTVAGRPLAAVGAGLALGLIGALALGRGALLFLYEIGPSDPWTLGGVAAAVLGATLAAAAVPARRALRVDPISALRAD